MNGRIESSGSVSDISRDFFQTSAHSILTWLFLVLLWISSSSGFPQTLSAGAARVDITLKPGRIQYGNVTLEPPLTEPARSQLGRPTMRTEVQVITCGPLALVGLPGEPLIDLAITIQNLSPFPHTLVLGYSNGSGVRYVGMPGEKARGGYEMGAAGAGTDDCGQILVESAVRLLREQRGHSVAVKE